MTDYEQLKELCDEIDILLSNKYITSGNSSFKAWKMKTERFLRRRFGENSPELKDFLNTSFEMYFEGIDLTSSMDVALEISDGYCRRGLEYTKRVLEIYLQEIEEKCVNNPEKKGIPMQHNAQRGNSEYIEKKYQVFVSSTYKDLKEERALVMQCLLDLGFIPVGMEQFPASGMSQMEYIKKMLADCDYYILILAGCYGSLDSDGVSFTEKEYDYAVSIGLPVMSFVVKDVRQLPQSKCESTDEGKARLEQFRKKVCNNRLVKMYSSSSELPGAVAVSVQRCVKDFPAVGWVRANQINDVISDDTIDKRIEKYLNEHIKIYQGETS